MSNTKTAVVSLKKKPMENVIFKKYYILIGVLGFFISRAGIIKGLTPFGIAFLTASLGTSFSLVSLLSVLLGLISFHGLKGYNYLFTAGLIYMINILIDNRKLTKIKVSILSSVVFFGVSFIHLILFKYIYIYDIVMTSFETIVIFTLSYIFSYSIPKIGKNYKNKYTKEEIICVFITLSLSIAGFDDMSVFTMSLKNILSILTVIIFGYSFGPTLGATLGVIIGMVSYIAQVDMPFALSIFGLSGLLAGVFKDLGKIGSILGFILGNFIISFYINGYGTSFLSYQEIGTGLILFIIIYRFVLGDVIKENLGNLTYDKNHAYNSSRISDLTKNRLNSMSEIFNELGNVIVKAKEREDICTDKVTWLIDQIARENCSNCSIRKFCWEEDLYTTYYSFFNLLAALELNGEIDESHLPPLFTNTCINTKKIITKTNNVFDLYRVNYMWEQRMAENRKLVSEQLIGISNIMKETMEGLDKDFKFNIDVEECLYTSLKSAGVDIDCITVAEFDNDFEIYVEVSNGSKVKNSLENIIGLASEVVGIPLGGDYMINNINKEVNSYRLKKANRYNAITRAAKSNESQNSVSGDSFTFGEEKNTYFAALSDGMGVGKKASFESSVAISLLEKFLEAGFNIDIALRSINSILMLKSKEESFTTLDIGAIDLYTGKLKSIKTGAATTFIKKKNEIQMINSHSLPVGILKDVDLEIYEEDLDDGDFIIMMTDGVLEANEEVHNKESWMMELIKNIDSLNPQTIANEILKSAKNVSNGVIKDDMTVLVTKVWKTY